MNRTIRPPAGLILCLLLASLAACVVAGETSSSTPIPLQAIENGTASEGITAAGGTGSATDTPTATPSPTATPTATPTPTPTPMPTHPLMIEVMRSREYPGSELVIETTLEPGENYSRFIASYLSEGNKIFGLLAVPNGPRPVSGWPIILLNHGRERPETYDVTLRYREHVDYFARNGYIVFHPAYRGHGESEGRAGDAFNNPNYTIDALNALAAVKTHPEADAARIGMWGHSMGGFITLRAMVVSDEIDAGVIWAGVVGGYPDIFAREAATATAEAIASPTPEGTPAPSVTPDGTPPPPGELSNWPRLVQTYGAPEENPAFWQSISATSYLADLSGPLQLHHATTDSSVPVTVSLLLQAQLEAAGQLSELYLYENDNHNLGKNFDVAMGRSLAFFDQHVKSSDE